MRPLPLVAVLALPLGGCIVAAVAAGAAVTYGVIKYTENGAQQDFRTDLDRTFAATVAALRHLGYPVAEVLVPGATEGRIATGDVTVRIARHPERFTRVTVRVGTFETDDHQRRARLILEEVQHRLREGS
jgi:hypothetical protein